MLTKNEMIIFLSLLNNIGKIVSRDELMTALWITRNILMIMHSLLI